MLKLLSIVGARPQFIKAACLSRALKEYDSINEILLHTGQHYDKSMSEIFFVDLKIMAPKYNLNVGSNLHGVQTAKMIVGIEKILIDEKPDLLIVYGDTNSTIAGAIAGVKLQIPIVHIEAGLRSYNRSMPEEINRVLTDHSSDFLFCPTITSINNLINEGFSNVYKNSDDVKDFTTENGPVVIFTGDLMYDMNLIYKSKQCINKDILESFDLVNQKFILLTIHRPENTDSEIRLNNIINTIKKLAQNIKIVWPIHPRIKNKITKLQKVQHNNIKFIHPVGYIEMLTLQTYSNLIVTDSGGVQKEAYFNKTFCITLREQSEWRELEVAGWNKVIPAISEDEIYNEISTSIDKLPPSHSKQLYGDGNSSKIMAKLLSNYQ